MALTNEEKAYNQGWEAYYDEKSIGANPYPEGLPLALQWEDGFKDAQVDEEMEYYDDEDDYIEDETGDEEYED